MLGRKFITGLGIAAALTLGVTAVSYAQDKPKEDKPAAKPEDKKGHDAKGTDAICKKVAEEAAETIMAAKDGDRLHLVREVTDLWFHSMILLAQFDIGVDDVMVEFRRREGISGIDEKNGRGE